MWQKARAFPMWLLRPRAEYWRKKRQVNKSGAVGVPVGVFYAKKNKISQNTIKSSRKKTKGSTQKGLIILNRSKNESVEKRIYTLISPDGTKFNLTSLREFCINNNLNDSALHRVGKGKLKHYKGWKCEYDKIILK